MSVCEFFDTKKCLFPFNLFSWRRKSLPVSTRHTVFVCKSNLLKQQPPVTGEGLKATSCIRGRNLQSLWRCILLGPSVWTLQNFANPQCRFRTEKQLKKSEIHSISLLKWFAFSRGPGETLWSIVIITACQSARSLSLSQSIRLI